MTCPMSLAQFSERPLLFPHEQTVKIVVRMPIDRATAVKLGSFAGVVTVAGACHYFGLGEHAAGLFGTALALLGSGAHALVGHMGLHVIEKVSEHASGIEHARGVEPRLTSPSGRGNR